MHVTTVGLDLAKHVFQVHGIDQNGQVLIRRQLRRGELIGFLRRLPPCLIGMEACSTAHFWARELAALGHEIRLMPAAYVKPYVKRGKSDALDAAGICEAVTRPTMRYVAIKNPEQQAVLMLHRTRELLVRQRTMLVNALRGHLAEYGIIAPQGLPSVPKLREGAEKARGAALPELAWRCVRLITAQLEEVQVRVAEAEQEILAWHRTNEVSQRPCGHHFGSALLPLGPAPGRLDRLGATPEWDGRQGAARAHLQTRGSISAPASGARGHDTLAACPRQSLSGCGMDQRALGPPPSRHRQGRHRQQVGSGRLGRLAGQPGLSRSGCPQEPDEEFARLVVMVG
jgi:transposase